MFTKENSLKAMGSISSNYKQNNYTDKKFPAFGKQLDELRRRDLVPIQRVIVTTDWKLGAAYPRIVIPSDARVDQFIFNYLTGLSVQIVHHEGEDELVGHLIEAIIKVKPKFLVLFNFDVSQQRNSQHSAFTLIYPHTLEEYHDHL